MSLSLQSKCIICLLYTSGPQLCGPEVKWNRDVSSTQPHSRTKLSEAHLCPWALPSVMKAVWAQHRNLPKWLTFLFFVQVNDYPEFSYHADQIQTHKRFKRMLVIRTKHNLQISRVIPFIKLENNTLKATAKLQIWGVIPFIRLQNNT